jgi:hypothetical protein
MAMITFIEIVVGLSVIALLLIPLTYVTVDVLIPWTENHTFSGNSSESITMVSNIWYAIPIIVAFGVLYYGIAKSQKKEGFI